MPVIEQAQRFRNELSRHESQATNQAINAYKLLTNRLEDKLTVLQSKFEVLESQNRLSPENVRKLAVWSSLLNQIEDEIDRYGGYVDTNNRLAATKSIEMATKHSEKLTATHFENNATLSQAFNATWDRLPTESIETLLGFLQQDSQLRRNLTQSLGVNAAQNFQNRLLEGIALGYNPTKINSLINQSLGEPLTWSLNTIRTTQLYSYREATRANYVNNSEIVGGWKWYAALDGRTCMSCVNRHGMEFSVGVSLNDHHQGRCTQIPLIDRPERFGLKPLEVEMGEDWFNKLPNNQQVQMMGYERLKAYKQGKFAFSDLSEPYQNDVFGEMIKEASLKSLLSKSPVKSSVKPSTTSKTSSKATPKPTSNNIDPKEIFRLKNLAEDLEKDVNKALELIGKVHKFPKNADKIDIKSLTSSNTGVQGQFTRDSNGKKEIAIRPNGNRPVMTTIHEIGHYIDYHVLSPFDETTAKEGKQFEQWRKTVENSAAYKKLESMRDYPDKHEIDFGFAGKVKPEFEYTQYLMRYSELWARSYMQFIMTENGLDPELDIYRDDRLYGAIQWDKKDFKPIAEVIRQMLSKYK